MIAGLQGAVAVGPGGVHLGESGRNGEVVIECRTELGRPPCRNHRTDPRSDPVQELFDTGIGLGRVLQGGL